MLKSDKKIRLCILCGCYGKMPYGGPVIRMKNFIDCFSRNGLDFKVFHNPHEINEDYNRAEYTDLIKNIKVLDYNVFWVEQDFKHIKLFNQVGIKPIIGTNLIPNSCPQHARPYMDNAMKGRLERTIKQEKNKVNTFNGKFWLAQSDFQRREYRKLGLSNETPVYLAPNLIDVKEFYPPKNKPNKIIVGWTGKNNGWKRPQWLAEIASQFPEVEFRYFSDASSKLNLGKNVNQILGKTNKEMPEMLRECSIFMSTSISELQPLGIIEAMSTGLPVIAFRTSPMPELVNHNVTGKLVDLGNVEHYIIELKRLIEDTQMRQKMGERAREFVIDNFSYEAGYKHYMKIFKKYLER